MGLCLRRLVLQYPWRGGRVRPESVAAFNRNQGQPSPGIGGRFRPESVATFDRNTQPATSNAVERGNRRYRKMQKSVYRVRTQEQIRARLALDMWREAQAEGRQQTLASLHRARAG